MMFHVHYSVTSTDSEAGTVTGPKTSTGNPSGSNQAELTRLHYIYDAWNRLTYVKNDSGLNRHTAEGQIQELYAYDPYGRRQSDTRIWTKLSTSAKANSILYGGYVFDAETNNYYARNR